MDLSGHQALSEKGREHSNQVTTYSITTQILLQKASILILNLLVVQYCCDSNSLRAVRLDTAVSSHKLVESRSAGELRSMLNLHLQRASQSTNDVCI